MIEYVIAGAGLSALAWNLTKPKEEVAPIPEAPDSLPVDPQASPGLEDLINQPIKLADPNAQIVPIEHIKGGTPRSMYWMGTEDWHAPVVTSINGSTLMREIKANSETARRLFRIPFNLRQLERDPQLANVPGPFTKPQIINIDSWESFRYFGNMFAICLLQIDSQDPKQTRIGEATLNFLDYHAFQLHAGFRRKIAEIAVKASCKENKMLPEYSYNNALASNQPNRHYPAISSMQAGDWQSTCKSFCNVSEADKINVLAEQIGRNAIFEYGCARYMQIAFLADVDPSLAMEAAKELQTAGQAGISLATSAVGTLLASLLGASAASAAVPVVGWIGSAVAGIGAGIAGLVKLFGAIDKTRAVRLAISERIEKYLKHYMLNGVVSLSRFSGNNWHCLIPAQPFYDDIKAPMYQYFALGWTHNMFPPAPMGWSIASDTFPEAPMQGVAYAAPQLPFFYLGVDVLFPVSIAQPSGNFLCFEPILQGSNGPTIGVRLVEYTKQDFTNAIKNKR